MDFLSKNLSKLLKLLKNFHTSNQRIDGMASFTEDQKQIEREFAGLKSLYDQYIAQKIPLKVLSMGMSGDFLIAIEQGSNMIRVGSKIFGPRNY